MKKFALNILKELEKLHSKTQKPAKNPHFAGLWERLPAVNTGFWLIRPTRT